MAQDINETSTFEATIPSLITTDAVKGSVQGVDPNVGEANAAHINLANRTQWLKDNKVNKAGDTMQGDLTMEDSSVKIKDGANVVIEQDKNGRTIVSIPSKDTVQKITVGKKSLVIGAAGIANLFGTGLGTGKLAMVRAVLRDQGDGATSYICFGLVEEGGSRNLLRFDEQSGANDQFANKGYASTTGFNIQINGGILQVQNKFVSSRTIDIIVELSIMP